MGTVFEIRLALVWLSLSILTVVALIVPVVDEPGKVSANAVVTLVAIGVSMFKVRLILREFMEVRHANEKLQKLTDLWVIVTALTLVIAYYSGLYFAE